MLATAGTAALGYCPSHEEGCREGDGMGQGWGPGEEQKEAAQGQMILGRLEYTWSHPHLIAQRNVPKLEMSGL